MDKIYKFIGKIVVFAILYGLSIFITCKVIIFMLNQMTVYR